jgi:acetamidase/formamidase
MCAGDDHNCPQFELHRQKLIEDLDAERRGFLKSAFAASGAAAAWATGAALVSPASAQTVAGPGRPAYHYLPATAETVHWGYFSKLLPPRIEIDSGDYITIEALTHHANDDAERMIKGDPGAESVFLWTRDKKNVDRRGAGPVDGKLLGRGSGEGFGVHICTGPVFVRGAEPGDILEARIIDVKPRPCANPLYPGKSFGSNAAAWWGFQYKDLLTEPKPREVCTIYQIDTSGQHNWAQAVYNFRWTPQTDPFGVVHNTIDYPGVHVDHATVEENHGVLKNIRIPIRPHFGVMTVAPKEADYVDSIPPGYFGGNIDNWRIGKGATMYYPVAVPGALFSIGDSHAAQGDSELCGTAIECSLTGTFQLIVHKKSTLTGSLSTLDYPLLETQDEWVLHGFSFANYLAELGANAQQEIYNKSSIDLALRDAFHKMRAFLMNTKGLSEDEAISLISVAVDFGVTQVVDGNWGIHAILKKNLFAGASV